MDVRPTVLVTSTALTFTMLEGGTAPPAQTFRVSDASGGAFAWTASVPTSATWLRIDRTSGNGEATLSVSVNPAGLAPGTHTAAITVTSPGLAQSPQTVNVILTIARRPVISARQTELTFMGSPGQNPPVQRLEFSNTGGGDLIWTATPATTSGGNWLAVDQPRGTGNAGLQVIVQAGSLAPGAYDGTITLAATNAANVVVRVRYIVAIPIQVIEDSLRSLASRRPSGVSPGEILVIGGSNLTDACAPENCPRGSTYPLPTQLGGVRVTVNGIAAPLLLVTPTEIRFIVPFDSRFGSGHRRVPARRRDAGCHPGARSSVHRHLQRARNRRRCGSHVPCRRLPGDPLGSAAAE
jgi:hypothetical protein